MTLALSGYHWCFGWNRHSTVPSLDDSSFHLHRARKEDVIFQVHMLVKVRFELPQILVQSLVTCACIRRSRVFQTSFANLLHQFSRSIVLLHHGVNRVPHRLEEGRLHRAMRNCCLLQCVDVRKQNLFLFLHVHDHLSPNFGEESPNICNFGVILSVLCFYLVQQRLNPSDSLSNVPMVPLTDMPCQIAERCQCPICFVRTYAFAVFTQTVEDFFSRNICMQARFMQRFSPTAAVVKTGIFKNLPG